MACNTYREINKSLKYSYYGLLQFWSKYCNWNKDLIKNRKKAAINRKQYRIIFNAIFDELLKRLILDGIEYKLPYSLGTLQIVKYLDLFKKKIDYKNSKDLGKLVYYDGLKTGGYSYAVYWDRKNSKVENINNFIIIPTIKYKRLMHECIENCNIDFIEVERNKIITNHKNKKEYDIIEKLIQQGESSKKKYSFN